MLYLPHHTDGLSTRPREYELLSASTHSRNEGGKKHIPFGVFGEVLEAGRVAVGDTAEAVELTLLA